jgi:hypothetical protein
MSSNTSPSGFPSARCGVSKGTKTETTKAIPAHLTLAAMLAEWKLGRWAASDRKRWRGGAPAVFPPATYWLQRFASVPVLET